MEVDRVVSTGADVSTDTPRDKEDVTRSSRNEKRAAIYDAARKGPALAFFLVLFFGPLGALYLRPLFAVQFVVLAALAYYLHWSLAIAVWMGFAIIAPMQAQSLNKRLKRRIRSYVH